MSTFSSLPLSSMNVLGDLYLIVIILETVNLMVGYLNLKAKNYVHMTIINITHHVQ
jgi:hypothetical protein